MARVFRWPRRTKTGRRPGKIPKGLPAVASRAQRIRAVDRRGPRVGKGLPDRHDASVYAAPSTGAGKHHSRLVSPVEKKPFLYRKSSFCEIKFAICLYCTFLTIYQPTLGLAHLNTCRKHPSIGRDPTRDITAKLYQ